MPSYLNTLRNPAFLNASTGKPLPNDTGWQDRHLAALRAPKHTYYCETAIVALLDSWARYADAHALKYESGIGEDGMLGPAWQAIGQSIRTLLNGETGRLDCGTLDGFILDTLKAEGFAEE